ncbi:MAG: RHS repeat protein [Bryobacterales bacterium]|nr:RHS repeat protein [Bryobacterales bacterium]
MTRLKNFPGTANNGRITGTKDLQSLEEITYQYDALNRLTSATKTGGGWSETYGYDGFGNLNQKGASSWLIDTSTNRLHSSTGASRPGALRLHRRQSQGVEI